MRELARQRIRYLVEYGGVYPEEPATQKFVLKWLTVFALLTSLAHVIAEVLIS